MDGQKPKYDRMMKLEEELRRNSEIWTFLVPSFGEEEVFDGSCHIPISSQVVEIPLPLDRTFDKMNRQTDRQIDR